MNHNGFFLEMSPFFMWVKNKNWKSLNTYMCWALLADAKLEEASHFSLAFFLNHPYPPQETRMWFLVLT